MTAEEACRDPTALVLLCGERACAFYHCRAAAPLESASLQAGPSDGTPDEDAPAWTAAPGKVVLAQAVVEEVDENEEMELPSAEPNTRWWVPHAIGLGDTGPVFVIEWGLSPRPQPSVPSLLPDAAHLVRFPHALHHIFPAEKEFRGWFASKGIVPEDWTMPVPTDEYSRIHDGPDGGSWNAAWRDFIRAMPEATAADVWKHAGELCLRFGLFEPIGAGPRIDSEEPVTSVELDPATRARIDKALGECAGMASTLVLGRRMNGRKPTPRECLEEVGQDSTGKPITHAQELGIEMHQVALECAREKLGKLRPGGFSTEQRYRYDPRVGRATPMAPEEEQTLLRMGLGRELLGTIVPDVVIHAGNPARVQEVYDFKFPCVHPDQLPEWRRYPNGHPYQNRKQDRIYQDALGTSPVPVTPRKGAIR